MQLQVSGFRSKVSFTGIIGLMAVVCVGCAKVDNQAQPSTAGGGGTPASLATPTPSPSPIGTAGLMSSDVQGTWTYCGSDDTAQLSTLYSLTFSGQNFVESYKDFDTANCTGAPVANLEILGTFTLNGQDPMKIGTQITMAISGVRLTPLLAEVATYLNGVSECGISNWQTNTTTTIPLGTTCIADIPSSYQDILGLVGGKLYYANAEDTALDTTFPLTKM